MIRRARTSQGPRIAVTGASSGLGRALLERLAQRTDLDRLVGIDAGRVRLPGVVWRSADVRDPLLPARLSGVRTLVHLAMVYDAAAPRVDRRALNLRGTANVLDAARSGGVERVVLVTSVDVYGGAAGRSLPLSESAALLATTDSSVTGDLLEVERLADHAGRVGLDVVVLRPAALVGGALGPAYDGALLHSLSASRLLAARGVEPLWQLCHVEDLLSAVELAALGGVVGPAVVASDGWLTQREVERASGRRPLELPAAVALSTAERLHRIGATAASPSELDRLLSPVVVEPARLRAAGWAPAWTTAGALDAHLQTRSVGSGSDGAARTGAYSAAGATVALLGTAALVRRARLRRRR